MSVALTKGVVPTMAKLRLRELPLTKGTLFGGEWTTTVTVFGSPLKRAKGPEAVRPRKARVEGTPPLPISRATRKVPVVAVAKAEEAAPRKTPTPSTTPPSHPPLSPMLNDRPGLVGGAVEVFRPQRRGCGVRRPPRIPLEERISKEGSSPCWTNKP